jgi:hypothetical protein
MKVTTRLIRNISFATMMAVILLVRQEPALAVECGPYPCGSACLMQGGYLGGRGCDGPCQPESAGCGGVDPSCSEFCQWCNEQEGWVCGPLGGGGLL